MVHRRLNIIASRRGSKTLPDEVHLELIDLLFSNLLPLVVMGAGLAGVGALVLGATADRVLAAITIGAFLTTTVRAAVVISFQRRFAAHRIGIDAARRWERLYAGASFVSAVLLGAFGARALSLGYEPADMLVTCLIFGYGAGVVARVSIRPWICVPSLLLAVVPIAIASAMQFTPAHWVHATLLITFMTASLESVRHTYRTTLRQIETRREMAGLARHDDLTGLPNRLLLRERFNASLRRANEIKTLIGIHYIDLDLFKQVNDRFGHPVGDALLAGVSLRLLRLTRAGDTVARLGGDEFLVIQTGIQHRDEAEILARRIIREISAAYVIEGKTLEIGASVGISVAPADGSTMDELIEYADRALYCSKTGGRGGFMFFDETAALPAQKLSV